MTAKPMYFQEMITISVQMAMFGSAIQSWAKAPRPMFVSMSLTAPVYCSIRPQPVPTMTSEITYGTKIRTRISDRPRMFWLSRRAKATAAGPCITSDITTMKPLCASASRKFWSLKIVT